MLRLIIVNQKDDFPEKIENVEVILAKEYLNNSKYNRLKNVRLYNLCRSYRYQSDGYYVSLLAAARGHKIIPDITTIQDTKTQSIQRAKSVELEDLIQKSLEKVKTDDFEMDIIFGKTTEKKLQPLGLQVFYQFKTPLLRVFFVKKNDKWRLQDVDPISPKELSPEQKKIMIENAREFFSSSQRIINKKPVIHGFEMAILVNPAEKEPPSNKMAIKKFIKEAASLGINATVIGKEEYNNLGKYDALFIRETTYVHHHTYRFARRATVEGLVVMDDPESILRCTNKVYLAELLEKHNILTPRTLIIHKENKDQVMEEFPFPIILKLPDSCLSQGVKKVETKEELFEQMKTMLKASDLIIAQEYLPTDFDWRIGIINKQPLYACKYFMANGHWQITSWNGSGTSTTHGTHQTFPLEEVPKIVIDTALKAANLIGNGLYGVDVKLVNGKCYIIEVNDNPSIDAGVEDEYLKNDLYHKIMEVFLHRIIQRKNVTY